MLAERQHGIVTRRQLLAVGLGSRAIEERLARGLLHRVHRGVYAVGHRVPLPLGREMAAMLACGERAAVSHRSAAVLWELLAPQRGPIHVTVPTQRRSRAAIRAHHSPLPSTDVTRRHGIRITTPARTLADLAASADERELERAVAEALRRRLVSERALRAEARRGRPGASALRAVLDAGPAFTRSEAERRMLALIRAAGLPRPEANARVGRYEVDLLWPAERLIVEVDGYAFHGGRRSFELDRARDRALTTAGYRVLRFTWRAIEGEKEAVVASVAAALAARGATAGEMPTPASAACS
jgi:very-short-patch-repair endonuclease